MNDQSAPATVKGFLVQAVRAVELWLDPPEGPMLIREGLENSNVIGGQGRHDGPYPPSEKTKGTRPNLIRCPKNRSW